MHTGQSTYEAQPTRATALFLSVVSIYLLLSPGHFLTTPDEELNLRTTLSLIHGQRGAIPALPGGFASKRGIDGKEYAQYGLGLPVAATPWGMLGTMISPEMPEYATWLQTPMIDEATVDFHTRVSEQLEFMRMWLSFFGILIAAAGIVLFDTLVRRLGYDNRTTLLGTLLLAFCTYHWQHGRTFFTEPLVGTCLIGALLCVVIARQSGDSLRWWILAGVFWGYALLTRVDTIFTLPAAAWFLCFRWEKGQFRLAFDPKRIAAFAAPLALVLLIMMLYNQYRFDSFFSTGYEDQTEGVRFATPVLVGLHGFLLTPGRSLFLYSPPLLMALLGIVALYRRDRAFTVGMSLMAGVFLLAMSKWQNWAGGYDWGPRHIAQLTPLLMLFAVAGLHHWRWQDSRNRIRIVSAIALLGLIMQLLGLFADPVQTIREALDPWRNEVASGRLNAEAVIMQFMVYMPHFSGPVMHTQAVLENGPNLLWLNVARSNPLHLLWLVFPIACLAWSAPLLYRTLTATGQKKPDISADRSGS